MNNDKYRNISTKVKPEYYGLYTLWCDEHDTTVYDQTQILVEGFLAYTSGTYNLSDEMLNLKYTFEQQPGWKDVFNFSDHQNEPEVVEAVYFVGASDKKGVRPVLIHTPFMGQWTQTINIQAVVERTIENCSNGLYRDLRRIGAELHTNSALETIQSLVIEHTQHMNEEQLDEMFADNDRSEYGVKPKGDGPYKRKLNRRAELEKQREDERKADESQTSLDFQPFGVEW